MEKRRINFRHRLVTGLLILISAVSLPAQRQQLTRDQINSLKITPAADERLIADREIKFILNIPVVSSTDVEVRTPVFPEGIVFKSFRKTSNYSEGGTKLEMWISFEKTGEQNPGTLETFINNRRYYIPFEKVFISANPKDLFPTLIAVPVGKSAAYFNTDSDGAIVSQSKTNLPAGTEITLSVYLKNAQRAVTFSHNLPANCIFTEKRSVDYTSVKATYNERSSNLIDLGTFTWTPLKTGSQDFPVFTCDAYNYSNYKNQVYTPAVKMEVSEGKKQSANNKVANLGAFTDAFYIEETLSTQNAAPVTDEQIELAYRKIRRHEKLVFLLCLLPIFSTVLLAAVFALKRRWKPIPFLVLAGLILSLTIGFFSNVHREVFTGDCLYSIPEDKAKSAVNLKKGSVVVVEEDTGDWLYVKSDSVSGWARKVDFYGHE